MFYFQYACAQYVVGYLTKNESGMSKLLKAVNDQTKGLSNHDIIKEISTVLDKHREVSIQEAIYRMLSLNMTESSVRVKYLSTIHPHFRDGLIKGNLQDLPEGESVFHMSLHQYYENRDLDCIPGVIYEEEEKVDDYWKNISLAEFWARYDIHYGANERDKEGNLKYIPLTNKKGLIKRRPQKAVIRYYLNHSNDEDLARGLLILFYPFQNEMVDIHEKNVTEVYFDNEKEIEKKRNSFEKHKILADIITTMQKEPEDLLEDEGNSDELLFEETTSTEEIESFEKWAKEQAQGMLRKHKELTSIVKLDSLRDMIMRLNDQQRRIFDDFCERMVSEDENPTYLFIAGE